MEVASKLLAIGNARPLVKVYFGMTPRDAGSPSDRKTALEEFVIWGITAGERWGRELYRFSERLSEKDSDKLRIGGLYYYAQLEGGGLQS